MTEGPTDRAGAAVRPDAAAMTDADLDRRFGGLRRLYGDSGYAQLRGLRVAVVGLGGVGSWAVEALARSGVASLVLIDMDHVGESNINRQVQALGATLGMAKGEALRQRVLDIHPGCRISLVDDFVTADNWPALLPEPVDALIDACDQVRAKLALMSWARATDVVAVCCGAAGGKRLPQRLEVDDLSSATHDPLLASLRQRWRKLHGTARGGGRLGVRCVFSREPVAAPGNDCAVDGSLNCHGYGSTVAVTASAGFIAAAEVIEQCLRRSPGNSR